MSKRLSFDPIYVKAYSVMEQFQDSLFSDTDFQKIQTMIVAVISVAYNDNQRPINFSNKTVYEIAHKWLQTFKRNNIKIPHFELIFEGSHLGNTLKRLTDSYSYQNPFFGNTEEEQLASYDRAIVQSLYESQTQDFLDYCDKDCEDVEYV